MICLILVLRPTIEEALLTLARICSSRSLLRPALRSLLDGMRRVLERGGSIVVRKPIMLFFIIIGALLLELKLRSEQARQLACLSCGLCIEVEWAEYLNQEANCEEGDQDEQESASVPQLGLLLGLGCHSNGHLEAVLGHQPALDVGKVGEEGRLCGA